MNVLLTGATGFVGKAVCNAAVNCGMFVRSVIRSQEKALSFSLAGNEAINVRSLEAVTDWSASLIGIDVVIHCAARVHVMKDHSDDPLAEFRKVNVFGTLNLARQAAIAGVRRFVFISSIKVNGESTCGGHAFTAEAMLAPQDAYGLSKAEAEAGLWQIAQETGLEVVIIRAPLVYGPGVKGNFSTLIKWIDRGFPLPLGGVNHNRRSLVALDNLVDLILVCVDHPNAANQAFLVSDGDDISTTELLRRIGKVMGKPVRLIPIPSCILRFIAILFGKHAVSDRLFGSLQVDISKTCELLNWLPSISVEEGLRRSIQKKGGK